MLIAQLSDLHIGVPGEPQAHENFQRLQETLRTLENLRPRPDLVLATGDLTETGSEDAYRVLKRIFDKSPLEIWPCMGNHDRRNAFRKVFTSIFFDGDYVQYAVDTDEVRIIVIDTLGEGITGASFTSAQAEWLDDLLSSAQDLPTVIAQHHPPVFTGIDWRTAHEDEQWVQRFQEVIARHPQVKKILTGHIHRPMERPFAGTSLVVSGATSAQTGLDLSALDPNYADGRALRSDEPPAFSLHFWDGEEIVTHRGVVGAFDTLQRYDDPMRYEMRETFRVRPRRR